MRSYSWRLTSLVDPGINRPGVASGTDLFGRRHRNALGIFGAVQGRLTGINMAKSAFQTMLVGGVAAGAAFYLASLFG
jgi:hypothetical protein